MLLVNVLIDLLLKFKKSLKLNATPLPKLRSPYTFIVDWLAVKVTVLVLAELSIDPMFVTKLNAILVRFRRPVLVKKIVSCARG